MLYYQVNILIKKMSENTLKTKNQINYGPSGRAVSQEIDQSLLDNLSQHLTMERNASVQYFSMSYVLGATP